MPLFSAAFVLGLTVYLYWKELESTIRVLTHPVILTFLISFLIVALLSGLERFKINYKCLKCGSFNSKRIRTVKKGNGDYLYLHDFVCKNCGHKWSIEQDTEMNERSSGH